ncbi:MAG: glycosyltransferase family 39 protein, partial [Chloroflexia bacterium]
MSNIEGPHGLNVTNNSSPVAPRRYSGRAQQRTAAPPRPGANTSRPAMPIPMRPPQAAEHIAAPTRLRPAIVPWSLRLVIALGLVVAILIIPRAVGLFTAPIGAPTGVEATYAAGVNVLAGHIASPLEPVRFLPPPAPWYGTAPVNPTATLPLYIWLTAGLSILTGDSQWSGRAISIVFSLIAGMALFALVRRSAGARAGIYALLLYSVAPLSIVLGQQYSPASLVLAAQACAMLMLVLWRSSVQPDAPQGSTVIFGFAVAVAAFYALLDPGAVWLAIPSAYALIAPTALSQHDTGPLSVRTIRQRHASSPKLQELWNSSPNKGRFITYAGALVAASFVWWGFTQAGSAGLSLGAEHGRGGLPAAIGALFNAASYTTILGILVERVLTIAGLLLLAAGVLHGARPPLPLIFHVWLGAGVLHTLFDASRLPAHEDVLLPLILPACALAGIGAAWVGALPARIWLAITEQKRERDADYAISPHTAWLLDLPEEKIADKPARPQAQLALGKSVAQRSQTNSLRIRRAWWLAFGHFGLLVILALIVAGGAPTTLARLQPNASSQILAAVGAEVSTVVKPDARVIIAGPHAPELFYSMGRTGWSLSESEFNLAEVQRLQRAGEAYLLSVDQDWLGKHPEYRGMITTYGVAKLSRDYILFDLNSRPEGNNRL